MAPLDVLVWQLPGGFAGEDTHRLAHRRLRSMLAVRLGGAGPTVRHESGPAGRVIDRCVRGERPRVLVLPTFRSYLWTTLDLARELATAAPEVTVLASGWGTEPSFLEAVWGERPIRHPRFAAVRGEVEEGLVDAVESVLASDGWPLDALVEAGLAVPDGAGGWLSRGRFRTVEALAALPSPLLDGDLHPDEMGGMALIEVARGCPHRCGFCLSGNYPRARIRSFPIDRIQEEIRAATARGAESVGLLCSGLNYDGETLEAIADGFDALDPAKRPKVESTIHTAFLDTRRLAAVGRLPWRRMIIGLQSTNPRALEQMGRDVDLGVFRRAIETISAFHTPVVELILGLPGDDLEGFASTMRFVLDLPAQIEVYRLRLDPGSRFFGDREELGIVADYSREARVVSTRTFSAADIERAALALRQLRGRRWPYRARRLAYDFELIHEQRPRS